MLGTIPPPLFLISGRPKGGVSGAVADRAAISVATAGTSLSTAGVLVFARPAPAPPSTSNPGEASGSECLRLPPQVGPQATSRSTKTPRDTPRCAAVSLYRQPSTIRHSSNARSSGARFRPAVFTRRDYIMVATHRANDLKIRWVHCPHLCRTLAHRVVRVGRLLQTRPKVSGVVCHRNYCPGLLTHGSSHPSIGNCGYIQPQDS